MVRKGHNLTCWLRSHQLLKAVLLQSPEGIRRQHLAKKAGVTKPTVDAHMKDFIKKEHTVVKEGPLYFWKHNYEQLLQEKEREIQRQLTLRIVAWKLYKKILNLSREERPTFNVKEYYEELKRKAGLK